MSDVLAACRAKYGDTPCIPIYSTAGVLREAFDCVYWCPLLNRAIEDEDGRKQECLDERNP